MQTANDYYHKTKQEYFGPLFEGIKPEIPKTILKAEPIVLENTTEEEQAVLEIMQRLGGITYDKKIASLMPRQNGDCFPASTVSRIRGSLVAKGLVRAYLERDLRGRLILDKDGQEIWIKRISEFSGKMVCQWEVVK